jgi:predicted regulator of Ras-like GTPase activity (Roadblock/LC7/MglB family)
VPYQALLEGLLRSVPGAETALLLDSEGEVVFEAGGRGLRPRLIGAYQGIALNAARRTGARYLAGEVRVMHCRYDSCQVILMVLRDGYYLVLVLRADASSAVGLHRAAEFGRRLDAEL